MSKLQLHIVFGLLLLLNEAYALSSKQLIMFKTVREHLLYEREILIDTMCVNPTYVELAVVSPLGEEAKYEPPIKKTREQCISEFTRSCRNKTETKYICEVLEKAARYDRAYVVYDQMIKEKEQENLNKPSNTGFVYFPHTCGNAQSIFPVNNSMSSLCDEAPRDSADSYPNLAKKKVVDTPSEKIKIEMKVPILNSFPAMSSDAYERSNKYRESVGTPVERKPATIISCEMGVEGFR